MLNRSQRVGDRLTLRYHSDRPPSDWIIRKLVITVTHQFACPSVASRVPRPMEAQAKECNDAVT
jgi:hypothetical protein